MYVNGHVDIFDMVDIDLFTVVALNMMVVQLGYTGESDPLFYNYLRPLTSLDKGLYDFACKEDVCFLATIVRSFKFIEVYIGEGVTALDSYIRPPRFRETIDDITDEPGSIAAIEHRYEKMLLLTWHDSSELTKEPVCESVTPSQLCLSVQSPVLKIGGNGPGSGHFDVCLVPADERSLSFFDSDGYYGIMYVNGHVDIFDMVDIDLFTVVALNMVVVQLGYTGESDPLFYNYLRPLTSLDNGLYDFTCEEDVCFLATLVRSFKLIEVIKDVIRQLSFKETELDREAGFGDVVRSGVKCFGLSHDESFRVDDLDLNLNKPMDLNVPQNKTQSELLVSEELDIGRTQEPIVAVVRTQEPIMEEFRTQKPIVEDVLVEEYVRIDIAYKAQYDVQSSKDTGTYDDDDFLVDEENKIVEPDVDVLLFGISMDVPFDNIGVTNLVPDEVLEGKDMDVINADGFDSNPGNDDETSNYMRRRLAELSREIEDNAPKMFLIRIHLGGKFQRYLGIMYVNGHVDIFDMVDINLFIVVLLIMMVVQLGYTSKFYPLFYNYLRPLTSLDEGLYAFACKDDVCFLATLVRSFKLIEVYIEHGVTVLDSYIRPPWFRETVEDITDKLGSIATIEHRYEKMLLLTWHDSSEPTKEHVCESITPRSFPQHDSSTPCKDLFVSSLHLELDREACFDDVVRSGVKRFGLSHDESFGVNDVDLNVNKPMDLNISQIETQSELLVSEEPDIIRTQEPIVAVVNGQEDESVPSDRQFFYDNEGIDTAYETQYDVYMDVTFDNIGVTNLVPDDVLEVEDVDVINADGFDSNPGNDDETSYYRRKRLAELSREIEGVINASGQWKYLFYTGRKFTTTKETKDIVYLHSIKSKINLKLYKNDSVRVKARCDGKVSVYTMSQGIGLTRPNHGMEAGPSGSSGPSTRSKKRRIHVPIMTVKHGVRAYRKELLGLDGSFMKRSFPRQVLAAVGLDSNNGIYPLAYALVEAKRRIALDDNNDDVLGALSLDSRLESWIDDAGVLNVLSLDSRIRTSVFGIKKMKLVKLGMVGPM
nr:hypothetical protein [Tanacetum cinerariifolium]